MTTPDPYAAPGWSADGKPWPWTAPLSWDLCMEDFAEVKKRPIRLGVEHHARTDRF